MIRALVDFALNNRFVVLALAILAIGWGAISFHNLPVEAYPDIADNYVTIITQWPGRAAEEVEQQVTIPLEIQMNGIPHLTHLRSESLFGLSFVLLIFDDNSVNDWNRQKVLERMAQADLPDGLSPSMGTDWSLTGQIYWYVLRSTNPKIDLMDLRSIQDWQVIKELKSVPDIVDVSTFGGTTREYQVRVDPNKLVSYGLNIGQVEQQLSNNNVNAGGNFVETGLQQMNVRTIGLFRNVDDIAQTVLITKSGTPLRVKDIAQVTQGAKVRLGHEGRSIHRADGTILDNEDVIFAQVMMRKGADSGPTIEGPNGLHAKVNELNNGLLPPGVKLERMIDRSDLLKFTLGTVEHNLAEGMILVTIILFLFLLNVRAAFIVALTIPFSLLFASIFLDLTRVPVNLLSLGALDFGMVVDGAVVMVENIIRHLSHRRDALKGPAKTIGEIIREACHEVQRPVFYAIAIIITAYLPIFTLQRIEGRLFRPMAWTVAFALLGAMTFSILLAPVLAGTFFRKGIREIHNPVMDWLLRWYRAGLSWAIQHRWFTIGVGFAALAATFFLGFGGLIGGEFLPHLDEGSIWARGTLAQSTNLTEGTRFMHQARLVFASFPEVIQCISQIGRPDDGTDTGGFGNTEYFVDLKPKAQWRPVFKEDKDELIAAMNREVSRLPGAAWNFSQPIEDNVGETVTGTKGQLALKIYGNDLATLERMGEAVIAVMQRVPGITDVKLYRDIGQPNLNFTIDRKQAARFGVNVTDIQDVIETAVGGKAVSTVLPAGTPERYDVVVRYLEPYRRDQKAINNIRLVAPSGERVSLAQLTKMEVRDGAYDIYREGNSRYLSVTFNVRGRDLNSSVEQAMRDMNQKVKFPPGYRYEWSGEYESSKRASARLAIIVPITVLVIFILLYTMFRSAKWALLILAVVSLAPLGGLLSLLVTGTHFSVSSGIGFLALFGVSVQTGVIMLEYINQLRAGGHMIFHAAVEGAVLRLRPIMMTSLVATFGLVPAALSHEIGSDSQRPFAIVIVGGLIVALLMSLVLLPTLYVLIAREGDTLPKPEASFES
jgi:cobalt-zinc-cadmium resistance protein CzcA